MKILNAIWGRFLQRIKSGLRSSNYVEISKDSAIHTTARLKDVYIKGQVTIGSKARLQDGVTILAGVRISIGSHTAINGPNTDILSAIQPITIGKFCSIARNVSIQEYNHNHKRITAYYINQHIFKKNRNNDFVSNGPIVIGNDVWIGTKCSILSGVTIGNGAIIGANSVVSSDIPDYAIALGSPARVVKYRFSEEVIAKLQRLQWWEWPEEKIRANENLFASELDPNLLDTIE